MSKIKLHEQCAKQEVIYCYETEECNIECFERIKLERYFDGETGKWMDFYLVFDEIDKKPEYMDETYIKAVMMAINRAKKDYGE